MLRTDVHTHLIPPLTAGLLEAVGLTVSASGRPQREGHTIGPDDIYAPERLAAWLASVELDRALVSIPPPLYAQGASPKLTLEWVRTVNDALKQQTQPWSALEPLGYLPLDQPDVAVDELHRLASQGWAGVTGCAGGASLPLHHASLAPLWSALATLGMPLVLHPGSSPDERLRDFYLENLLGNPQESTLAVAQLLFGRVLLANPGLRIAIVHGGGVVPALAGRWQRGVDTSRPGLHHPDLRVADELRASIWIDCLTHDASSLDLATSLFGEDHVLLGSDWPFPMGTDNPRSLIAHRGAAFVEQAARMNAAAFVGRS